MSSLRLVLVGKTGAGKSSAGNTILGEKEFKACVHFNAVTTQCQKGESIVNGRTVTVVDTPGVADLHVSVEKAKDRVAECFSMSAPGPHAFLLVIKLGRFTPEEEQAADVIRDVFGEAALEHTIVLFTHGDELENPDDIKTLLSGCEELTFLLKKVRWRYHVFNNKRNDHTQVFELLKKIDKMVGERGRHYTSEQFQVAEEKRKEEQEEKRKRAEMEKLRKEWYDMPELRILLIGKSTASNRIASKLILEGRNQCSDTEGCQKTNGEVHGRRVSVVETPGLSDTCRRSEKEIMHEILSCIFLTSPGPHAFVIVERYREESAERKDILEQIKNVFGEQAKKYVILLAIERSANPVHSSDNDGHSAEHSPLLHHVEHEHLLTYIYEDKISSTQVTSLLQEIDRMVERNGGSSFTNEMYSEAEEAIINAQQKILDGLKKKYEHEKGYENSLTWKQEMMNARKQAEQYNFIRNCRVIAASVAAGTGIGALLGAGAGTLVGGPVGTGIGAKAGASILGAVGAVAGGATGAAYRYKLRKACRIQ